MLTDEQTQMLTELATGLSTPPRTPVLRTPADSGLDFEDVTFETADGVTITGWFIPADSTKIVVSNHFSPGNRYGFAGHLEGLDFAGGFEVNFMPRYRALNDAGYNVLAYDLRSHGNSGDGEGAISGVGYYEWQEVIASLDYDIDGNHIIECPHCAHHHCRVIVRGEVTAERWDSRYAEVKVAKRNVWKHHSMPMQTSTAAAFIRDRWMNRE